MESVFQSESRIFQVYKEWCIDNDVRPAVKTKLHKLLKEMHEKIHAPRKNQCDMCISHDLGTCDEDEYEAQITRKI